MKKTRHMLAVFCAAAALLIACGQTQEQPESAPEATEVIVTETVHCEDLGIFLLDGQVVDQDGIAQKEYRVDPNGNVLRAYDGTILVMAEDTRVYTYAEKIEVYKIQNPVLTQMKTTDGKMILEEGEAIVKLYLAPGSVNNTVITAELNDSAVNTIREDMIRWDSNGFTEIHVKVTEEAVFHLLLKNGRGEKLEEIEIVPEIKELDETVECEHDYIMRIVEATESTRGYVSYHCVKCGANYQEGYSPAVPHECEYHQVVIPSTCTKKGSIVNVCSVCNRTETVELLPLGSHTYTESVIAPTASSKGYTLHTCTVCGKTYKDHYVEAGTESGTGASGGNGSPTEDKGLQTNPDLNKENASYDWSVSYPGSTSQEDLEKHKAEAVDSTVDVLKNYMKQDGMTDQEIEQGIKDLQYNTVVEYDPASDSYNIYVVYK